MEVPALDSPRAPSSTGPDLGADRTAKMAEKMADSATVHALVQQVLAEGRDMLTEPEAKAKALLSAYGIPVVATRSVGTEASAVAAGPSWEAAGQKVLWHTA